jgi:aryl-alcohol dehydrogenase-like predicted oxidoreductase
MGQHVNEKHDRREFLLKPVQWAAAAGLLTGVAPSLLAQSRAPQDGAKILTRTLGKTGISLPIVSLGFMNADVPGLIRRAYELGMRHIDTAAFYQRGRNEEMVGAMIKELGVRDRVVISTKVFLRGQGVSVRDPQARDVFRQVFEGSLKRLQMDHVDILYYHAIDSAEDVRAEGPLQALAELKKEGKTRFTGVSTHQGASVLPDAVRLGVLDVGLVTINYTMASNKGLLEAIDQASKAGMGIVAMKTQAGGLSRPDPKLPKALPPHSQTALLKWVLRNQSMATAIPGCTRYEQLEQNITVAFDLEYTDAEKAFLADKTFAAQAQFCQQCGQCRGDCPRGVDIPSLMRSHMYAVQYSNRELARSTLASLGSGEGLEACAGCSECQAACRNYVNIGNKIAQLKASPLVAA